MNIKTFRALRRKQTKSKYHNVRTSYKGVVYMSKKEALYSKQLDLQRNAKNPANRVLSWTEQVPFPIEVNGHKICKYLADFVVLYVDGHTEVVDVKGVRTNLYILKRKLVEACHNIIIKEV